jgi:hypothetical protein
VFAHHRFLTGFAGATTFLRSRLSVFPEFDNVLSIPATVGYDVLAKGDHLDMKVFVLGSIDCSLHCVGCRHCSLPFPFVFQSR